RPEGRAEGPRGTGLRRLVGRRAGRSCGRRTPVRTGCRGPARQQAAPARHGTVGGPRLGEERATIHFVPHTHWDREWYEPFQVFRIRLIDLVDSVLDHLDHEPAFRFTLDGQLATIDDYLEVRPGSEGRISRFVR